PTILDCDGAALGPAEFAQSLHKGGDPFASCRTRALAQEADGRQPVSLLRARSKRPRCRAAEERDERAAVHSITSSAGASSVAGTSMPTALAVARLMTNSNLVGCTTGRSAGLAPLRMRPVYVPTWR